MDQFCVMSINWHTLLFWSARITGTLVLVFLVFMVIGHVTGDANGPKGMVFEGLSEMLQFILFPVCSIIGLSLAYWRPLLGGEIVLISLTILIAIRNDLLQITFFGMMLPGVLYFLLGLRDRITRTMQE